MPGTSLDIRLAEPVVFLRGSSDTVARRRNAAPPETAPAMVRGILTLKLAKATKIKSIGITLEGRAKTEWPEGIGSRRAEVTEDVSILSSSTVFFRAGHEDDAAPTTFTRRAMSLGPGVGLDHEADDEGALSDDEGDGEDPHPARRDQGTIRGRRLSADQHHFQRHFVEHNDFTSLPTPPYSPRTDNNQSSVPGSPSQTLHELRNVLRSDIALARSPVSSRPPSINGPVTPQTTAPRGTATQRVVSLPSSQIPSTNVSSDASVHSFHPDISEHPSDEEAETNHLDAPRRPSPSRRQSSASLFESPDTTQSHIDALHLSPMTERQRSISRSTVSHSPAVRPGTVVNRPSPSPAPPRPILQASSPSPTTHTLSPGPSSSRPAFPESPARDRSESRVRGRPATRFSLSAVSNVLHEIGHEITEITDRVRSKSRASTGPKSFGRGGAGSQKAEERGRDRTTERERGGGEELKDEVTRGRQKEREKSALEKIGASLGLGAEGGEGDGEGDMWQEFRKGTYNYPISFAIPSNTLPSLHCDFGSVVYRLKAVVHRAGTFVPKLVAQAEVTLISSPGENDTEETDNIVVERQWGEQLRYFINISGKSFPVGGVVPVTLTLMPLDKVRIYRISVILEEKIDYYAHGRRVARHDPTRNYELMSLKHSNNSLKHHHEKHNRSPLLPIIDDGDARDSPLFGLVEGRNGEGDGEGALNLWNPNGPWTLQLQAHLPTCSSPVHFTCKHPKSNITISHWIKIVIRVDRGEEEKDQEKKRKQFDIIIETPVHLLSCKCNPEYTALPAYTFSSPSQNQRSFGPVPPGECLCDHSKAERQNLVQPAFYSATAPMPIQGLGYGAFNVPPIEFGAGLRRTSSGPNASAPDRMMTGLGADGARPGDRAKSGTGAGAGASGSRPGTGSAERPPNGRSAESAERLTTLVDRSLQFARLVSGEESVSGDVPPAYADAVNGTGEERGRERGRVDPEERGHVMFTAAAIAESRSGSQSRTQSRSRPASRPGSRPGSRPNSRPPSIMWT
ncbi:hypothetical protein FRC08_017803 [Ceratobasidium sp. 394]|nr:hypothetical protein FRC08_017803 [Ceratobasidium sp. 394]